MIASRPLFDQVSSLLSRFFARDMTALVPVIAESCAIKAGIVEEDERETGLRRHLNFGHTAGHALEAVTRYRRFRHGEAVAYGMLAAADIARQRGSMAATITTSIGADRADGAAAPGRRPIIAQVIEAVGRDKKVIEGRLHFVLPTSIGTCEVAPDVTQDEIVGALQRLGLQP